MTPEEYVQHLLAGDEEVLLEDGRAQATDLEGLHRLYVDTIEPSQYRVGQLWESGDISVASEHMATAINSYVASMCYEPLARATTGGPPGLVTCTPEELHELGPRMLADLLECDGWDVDFLGASTPAEDVIAAIRDRKPRFIGLSTALVLHLGSVKSLITEIRTAIGDATPPVVVGGNAFRGDGEAWRQVGADLYAPNASAAVELLRGFKD